MLDMHNNSGSNQDLIESGLVDELEPINFYKMGKKDSSSVQYMPNAEMVAKQDESTARMAAENASNGQQSRQSIKIYNGSQS